MFVPFCARLRNCHADPFAGKVSRPVSPNRGRDGKAVTLNRIPEMHHLTFRLRALAAAALGFLAMASVQPAMSDELRIGTKNPRR